MAEAGDDFCVGQPGLGSNIEVLAALRGSQRPMTDLLEDPGWVREKFAEIIHAILVKPEEAVPLLDAVGPAGKYAHHRLLPRCRRG
jgi:hypothetical protein